MAKKKMKSLGFMEPQMMGSKKKGKKKSKKMSY